MKLIPSLMMQQRNRTSRAAWGVLALASIAWASGALAQPSATGDHKKPAVSKQAAPANPAQRNETLNFESDVIEGQKRAPDLFLQTENQKIGPEALIYIRPDFNDFQRDDQGQRPAAPADARSPQSVPSAK